MKKLLLPVIGMMLFSACQKQPLNDKLPEEVNALAAKNNNKINICHKEGNGSSHIINISINAWPAHQAHGDVRLDDQDGDGYVLNNACGLEPMGDCNDLNAAINPVAVEICGNSIDDNCNGQIDETCIPSVIICSQIWMAKNLDVSTYRNGDPIPEIQDAVTWSNLTTGAWCYYENNTANGAVYGKLYNWYAVMDPRGLAPAGWHVPTLTEWIAIGNCLPGMPGEKLKEAGTTHWLSPNYGATNSSGFTALPGGYRGGATFGGIGEIGEWWSSTEYYPPYAKRVALFSFSPELYDHGGAERNNGLSVRCVKD